MDGRSRNVALMIILASSFQVAYAQSGREREFYVPGAGGLIAQVKTTHGPPPSPPGKAARTAADDASNPWQTRILIGNWVQNTKSVESNMQFKALEDKGYEIEVVGCQFNEFRPDKITVKVRKSVRAGQVRTEAYVPPPARKKELEKQGYEVAIVCLGAFGFNNGLVIQYWR